MIEGNISMTDYWQSPLGWLKISVKESAIVGIDYSNEAELIPDSITHPLIDECKAQLTQYFAKKRRTFDLPLAPAGTDFQRKAWQALLEIPFGETRSYGEQAAFIHHPKAVRAIGQANGRNPISIVIPCHRVIGRQGQLTGYAAGLNKKRWLLCFEQQ